MKFDWKAALVTIGIVAVGFYLIRKFIAPLLPASAQQFVP